MEKQKRSSWLCCFRPKVAESGTGEVAIKRSSSALRQEKEDSANEDGFAHLSVGTHSIAHSDEQEDFGSPASSYVTCFSEQDPHDIGDSLRWAIMARLLRSDSCSTFLQCYHRGSVKEARSAIALGLAPVTHILRCGTF